MFGAGSGSIFLLRWYWWRVNAPAEIAAMLGSGLIALSMTFLEVHPAGADPEEFVTLGTSLGLWAFPSAVLGTNLIWLAVMFLTPPTDEQRLLQFHRQIRAGGPGWSKIAKLDPLDSHDGPSGPSFAPMLLCIFLGCLLTYAGLFGIGWWLYGQYATSLVAFLVAMASGVLLWRHRPRASESPASTSRP